MEPAPSLINMPTVSRQVVVSNSLGLHARPAMRFVDAANGFSSSIRVLKGGAEPMDVDGKSIMEMITLAAEMGTPLTIRCDGSDAEAAADKLAALFAEKFGEE
jgi:phosphotransferase system HPr (HPr) family protein